ncbi:MAG: hypothetical protein AB8G15_03920 [Saprospiraceae bacterium]
MKTIKFNSIFFVLFATLSCAILFTACSKEDLTPDVVVENQQINPEQTAKMLLPKHITSQGEEGIKTYLQQLSVEQKTKHLNDYIIGEYLSQKGIFDDLNLTENQIGLPSDLNLSNFLTGEEIKVLKDKLIHPESLLVQSRGICFDVLAPVNCILFTVTGPNGVVFMVETCAYEIIGTICL